MRFLRMVIAAVCAASLTGCMWIVRLPFPESQKFSDDGVCTNRTWQTLHPARKLGYYPCSVGCRYVMLKTTWRDIDSLKGRERYEAKWTKVGAPFAFTLSLVGFPLDFLVDTICLYPDYRDRNP